MKRFLARILLFPLLLVLISGCLTEANQGAEAGQIVSTVHKGFQTGVWDAVMPLYDEQFLRVHPASTWQQKMTSLTKPLGKLTNIKSTFQHNDPRFRGDFYLYGFLLHFEHGTISETLTIYKGVDKDRMTISGHQLKLKKRSS
ncbi:MAG: hypothetical protein Q9M08_05365 [Mariprofundus sp.]|nr:hypothetical protein [Mariprofundus sp.]